MQVWLGNSYLTQSCIALSQIQRYLRNCVAAVSSFATCTHAAVGDSQQQISLYNSQDESLSEHGSIYSGALLSLHSYRDLVEYQIQQITLDDYVDQNNIQQIDFLKIDVEGHEFAVLEGCARLLRENRIRAIQFEFNEMHTISRVFLKDFIALLPDFAIYRMDTHMLHKLTYSPREEIFQFQNIFCIKKSDKMIDSLTEMSVN